MAISSTSSDQLFEAWRADLSGWGLPDAIVAAAPESPWVFPGTVFAKRAQDKVLRRAGSSYDRVDEVLPPGGSLLDVGSGGGAASLPHATKAGLLVAVDSDAGMLASFAALAGRIPGATTAVETLRGSWPDVAPGTPVVDVVVCHHVLYNVMDLRPFVQALTAHARLRVVVELTDHHPLEPMNPLWWRFHGLSRPSGPSAAAAQEAIASLGLDVGVQRSDSAPLHSYESFAEMVAYHRRRLCLPATADPEVADALVDLGVDPDHPVGLGAGRPLVTLWWSP